MVSGRRRTGRPPTANEIEALIVRVAEENRWWGEALRPELLKGAADSGRTNAPTGT